MDNEVFYTSPAITIGSTEWRLQIRESAASPGSKVTVYQFRGSLYRGLSKQWHDARYWPSYDFNDTYLGLPPKLVKLWEQQQRVLAAHGLAPQPQQGALF